jgi:uncharacterized phiE125 gp8 family phage protein
VTKPTAEPVTLSEAKKQLEIASSDTSHDTHLSALIGAAREQWEHDTDSVTCFQTLRLRVASIFDGFKLLKTPIHSITSIQYYDGNNTLQTWASNQYQLHVDQIRLAYLVTLPVSASRWDAWQVTYKAGHSQDGQSDIVARFSKLQRRKMQAVNLSSHGQITSSMSHANGIQRAALRTCEAVNLRQEQGPFSWFDTDWATILK